MQYLPRANTTGVHGGLQGLSQSSREPDTPAIPKMCGGAGVPRFARDDKNFRVTSRLPRSNVRASF